MNWHITTRHSPASKCARHSLHSLRPEWCLLRPGVPLASSRSRWRCPQAPNKHFLIFFFFPQVFHNYLLNSILMPMMLRERLSLDIADQQVVLRSKNILPTRVVTKNVSSVAFLPHRQIRSHVCVVSASQLTFCHFAQNSSGVFLSSLSPRLHLPRGLLLIGITLSFRIYQTVLARPGESHSSILLPKPIGFFTPPTPSPQARS